MTEDEAKTKWCPFSRPQAFDHRSAPNRGSEGRIYPKSHCIASACMAWRWNEKYDKEKYGNDVVLRRRRHQGEATEGHCGLAGATL